MKMSFWNRTIAKMTVVFVLCFILAGFGTVMHGNGQGDGSVQAAQKSKTKYKITYVLDHGKNNAKNPSTYTSGNRTIKLKNPTRKGYKFMGWYSSSSYKTKVSGIPARAKGNKKFYAKWAPTGSNYLYVSTKGKDTNKGTFSKPFKTIQRAIRAAKPGQTIIVRSGTYVGTTTFTKSGKKNAYITITTLKGEKPVVTDKQNSAHEAIGFDMNGQSYIKINGLQIKDIRGQVAYGIVFRGGEQNVTISNNDIHHICTTHPQDGDGEANGILLFGESKKPIKNVLIKSNKVHDNKNGWSENISVSANCENIKVINNKVYNNTNIGIDFAGNAGYCKVNALDHPRNCEATGNEVYNCKSSYAKNAGIYVDGAQNITISKNKVHHNYYGIEAGSEIWKDSFNNRDNQVKNIKITSNQIYSNSDGGVHVGGYTPVGQMDDETGYYTGVVTKVVISGNTLKENGFKNNDGGYNGEILFAKCTDITIKNNRFYKNNTEFPIFQCDRDIVASGGLGKLTFSGNVCYSKHFDEIYSELPSTYHFTLVYPWGRGSAVSRVSLKGRRVSLKVKSQ